MVRAGKISRRYTGAGGSSSLAHRAANPIARAAAYAAGLALRSKMRSGGSRTRTGTREVTTSYQNDQKVIYRKRRMPRRRRRRWVRAIRKNIALDMINQPTRTFTFNNNVLANLSGLAIAEGQFSVGIPLYSYYGLAEAGYNVWRDVGRVMSEAISGSGGQSRKFMFSSGVIDFTGVFQYNGSPENRLSADPVLELDMYVLDAGRRTGENFQDWAGEQADIEGDLIGNATFGNRGVTPFQLPSVGNSDHRLRIQSKRRWTLSVGQSFSYQFRDPRNRMFNSSDVENVTSNYRYRNYGTKVFFFLGKLIYTSNPSSGTGAYGIRIGHTRTYTIKEMLNTARPNTAQVMTV